MKQDIACTKSLLGRVWVASFPDNETVYVLSVSRYYKGIQHNESLQEAVVLIFHRQKSPLHDKQDLDLLPHVVMKYAICFQFDSSSHLWFVLYVAICLQIVTLLLVHYDEPRRNPRWTDLLMIPTYSQRKYANRFDNGDFDQWRYFTKHDNQEWANSTFPTLFVIGVECDSYLHFHSVE